MHQVTSKDGTKLAYDKTGKGPALVLIGGAFSYRTFPALVQLASLLSERFTVYTYDRRGRGDSEDRQPYAIEREIEDLQALIEAAGGSAHVWGLSSGAVLALEAAARGSSITKLALHEPPFVVEASDRRPPPDFVPQVTKLIAGNRRADAIKYFMTNGMGAPSFVVGMMRVMPGVWSRLMAVAHTLPYDAALLDGHSSGKPLTAESWSAVRMPTLVLAGTDSPVSLRHAAEALAKALPDARLVRKKELGHTKRLDAKHISKELITFLTEE